jgi:restriction endonuclease S subunit
MNVDLPENWRLSRLGSLTQLITKGSSPNWQGVDYVDEGTLFITSENVGSWHLIFDKKKYVEDRFNEIQKRSILRKGDLLTNIVGASIGRTAIFDSDEKANINQAVALIRLSAEVNKEYVLAVLNAPAILDVMQESKVDVARANISLKDVSDFPIPFPPKEEQEEIVRRVEGLFKIADKIEERYVKARSCVDKLTESILAKAFRGELVPQEPNDQPASLLLERIRAERAKQERVKRTVRRRTKLKESNDLESPVTARP